MGEVDATGNGVASSVRMVGGWGQVDYFVSVLQTVVCRSWGGPGW